MAITNKSSDARRKSVGTSSPNKLIVTLKVSPARLLALQNASSATTAPTMNGASSHQSPTPLAGAAILPPLAPSAEQQQQHHDNSSTGTPSAGTPGQMAPPDKKKGTKRGPTTDAKPRAKPGPKKKQRLEEGVEINNPRGNHRLGPKANMGAINAGLRALDRSGKPCRKWVKGSLRIKTFTGAQWEIPRWTAPVRTDATPESTQGEVGATTSTGSSKENKGDMHSSVNDSVGGHADAGAGDEMDGIETVHAVPVPIAAVS